jgi:alkanesulfonate monooxygenase SsuD/methylene tetrahydromethanopterin reductase-like flavin-dependent oxidoreductase (luciferase family)
MGGRSTGGPPVGVVLPARVPPEHVPRLARAIEALGFASLWLPEDAWDRGGIATLVAALDHTTTLRVGLGIAPAMARHPAVLAMELATVAALHGERSVAGIGLGVPAYLERMGLTPRSQLVAMRESMVALRRLLDGESLSEELEHATYRDVRLTFPPSWRVPLLLGVTGPRMLALSGEVADGTIATEMASVPYLRWARERIAAGLAARPAGTEADREHRLVAYAWFSIDDDDAVALEGVRSGVGAYLRREPASGHVQATGLHAELAELLARHEAGFEAAVPREWLRLFSVAGDADHVAAAIGERLEAGADEIALHPGRWDDLAAFEGGLEHMAREVLPRLSDRDLPTEDPIDTLATRSTP